jgi:hypothetical protein
MRKTFAACGLVTLVLVLASSIVKAQESRAAPEFARLAGTWDLDTSGDPSLPAERRIITVSPESFLVEIVRAEDARPPRLTYRFDGQDVVGEFGSGKATSRLVREPSAVVTETVYEINNSPITIRDILSVNAAGTELTVSTTLRVEHGYQGPLPAGASKSPNVSNSVVVFVKRP